MSDAGDIVGIDAPRREVLERQGRRWEYATTIWNSLEAVVAISSGLAAGSLGLVAFGLDSCVEVFASLVVLWHLGGATEQSNPARARRAMRLIGVAFGMLAVYLAVVAVRGLIVRNHPDSSPVGIAFLAATVVVMFFLAWGKRRSGLALRNRPLIANASMTLLDGCLAAGILLALILDLVVGWWWTDPIAAGVVAIAALNESREAWAG
jgi:divalent metal cation (Fe/Co/Zn/Cd) transporter